MDGTSGDQPESSASGPIPRDAVGWSTGLPAIPADGKLMDGLQGAYGLGYKQACRDRDDEAVRLKTVIAAWTTEAKSLQVRVDELHARLVSEDKKAQTSQIDLLEQLVAVLARCAKEHGGRKSAEPDTVINVSTPSHSDALDDAHGQGQENAISDANAGKIDDLIFTRLAVERGRTLNEAIRALADGGFQGAVDWLQHTMKHQPPQAAPPKEAQNPT